MVEIPEKEYQQLQARLKELEAANYAKSEFIANMTHELNTPLNSIIGFSEVLIDGVFGPLNNRQKDYANNVLSSGRQLLSLIRAIIDFSKLEVGEASLSPTQFSLNELLDDCLAIVREKAQKHSIALSLEAEGSLVEIKADRDRLLQVVALLLQNAVKFTPDGGKVKVKVELSDTREPQAESKRSLNMSVADTGIGVAKEDLDKLFVPLAQLDENTSKKYPGIGMGLALVKKIVELQGGKVWVESEGLGKGTTVGFTLPVS